MAITTQMVRELRDMTGAGMMDCKKALEATDGNIEAAVDHLRKAGMKSAGKKSDRETAEGRVFAAVSDDCRRGHLVGVACETDFLAKGDKFVAFVNEMCEHVATQDPPSAEALIEQNWKGGSVKVADAIKEVVGQFGENIRIVDLARFENGAGRVGTYVHHDHKQGAIVSVTTDADGGSAAAMLRSLCQHIVSSKPTYATREDVPADAIERERTVILESEEVKKKPEQFREKIVEGKLGKFYADCVLADQAWILDDKMSVGQAIEKELGAGSRVQGFRRVRLGS